MQIADGELADADLDTSERAKVEGVNELGELLRGHLELEADAVPDKRFTAMWTEIDKRLDARKEAVTVPAKVSARPTVWRRISRFFDHYRGHIITGAVSAGAVAALALVLRGTPSETKTTTAPIPVEPAAYRPTEIEDLDTPGATSDVYTVKDEDGTATVIWVSPEDTVEGI